jgi:hypothetical protein
MSKSGKPFDLRPVSPISSIGYHAPTLAALTHQGARPKKTTTQRPKATPSTAAATLVKAFKVTTLLTSILGRSQTVLTLFFQCITTATGASSATSSAPDTVILDEPLEVLS